MDTLCLGFLYFGNSLRSIKRGFGCFFKPKKKMVFGVRSIRVFSKFSLDPYYEALPWFMIIYILYIIYIIYILYILYLLYFAWADQRVQLFYNYHIVSSR